MHVAFNGYFWDQPRTGSGQYLRHLWAALDEVAPPSDRFTLLLPPGISTPHDVPTSGRARVLGGSPASAGDGKLGNLGKILWETRGVAGAARRSVADLLHVPYLSAPLPIPRHVRTVVTAHDMIPWIIPAYSGSASVRLYLRLAAACVRDAGLILADSEASRRDVINVLHVPPDRVHTVYLGMEDHPDYTPEQRAEVRSRHLLPDNYAFYLGGFDIRKNVPLLLRAWRDSLPRLECLGDQSPLLVIGGGVPEPGGIFPDVRAEAERLGFTGDDSPVRFLGRVSEEDKPLLMAAARLFAYPSAHEGFGLDPLEAMSVGCPVVSSSGGSLPEVVGDAGLLVPPSDEAALSEAMVRAWNSPELRAELSSRGRLRAATFTWQETARQTLDLYRPRTKDERTGRMND